MLHRVETGPMMDEKEFDKEVVGVAVKAAIAKYDIEFDTDNEVPSDDVKICDVRDK